MIDKCIKIHKQKKLKKATLLLIWTIVLINVTKIKVD